MSNVLVEHDPSPMKLEILNVDDWPTLSEPCGSICRTTTATEMNYILQGAGSVVTSDGTGVTFSAGDMVTVMPDTECTWNITEAIERHYSIG